MKDAKIKSFIRGHRNLFWYTPEDKKEEISPELLVETILNYGSLKDIRSLFEIIGMNEVARIFFSAEGRKKLNYFPEIYNYFSLYFDRYAQRGSGQKST